MIIEYLGNKDLLNENKAGFLASSTIPPDMVLKCYDWATQMAKEGKCGHTFAKWPIRFCLLE